ncbi:DUF2252 domain-containing protein [Nocardioides iriomotensis]|uniref:DUF2252 domain-containing protein n=1 Tax=Nocardioides iriomotensis TaxID=715784 RepID=A0A4Q5J5D8_9ACTN|nr:DUF2252 domain-containing protein [Nocardioides iriomotensis]RYU12909.1 DUF2252 domain-containing protein [Nocardioides iriomotensis]
MTLSSHVDESTLVRAARTGVHLSSAERAERGLAARKVVPPRSHEQLDLAPDRAHPAALAERVGLTRIPDLVPLRHARMAASPFAYFRGNALGMAEDLAATPTSGLVTQLCGDAHLSNFGLFGSAERRLLFDINDFDETFPGPWEWDVKRLATSIVVAGRGNGFSRKQTRATTQHVVRRYAETTAEFAAMGELEVWYARADADELQTMLRKQLGKADNKRVDRMLRKARASNQIRAMAKLTELDGGVLRFKAEPPALVPLGELTHDLEAGQVAGFLTDFLKRYRRSLPPDRRFLLDRFELLDVARKVVGVGSVGTRCWVLLMRGRDEGDPLFLQVKEAQASVLADAVPGTAGLRRAPANNGARVVAGQRLMQTAGDIFLGWNHLDDVDAIERHYYVRQLRDMKGSAAVETMDPTTMAHYGALCAWTLARAHARSGDSIAISSYLGKGEAFTRAVAEFAERYADVNERDHAAFTKAIAKGRLATAERPLTAPAGGDGRRKS